MAYDYVAARSAQANHDRQVAEYLVEATAYRRRADVTADMDEKQSLLDAARTFETQAEQARQRSQDIQRQMEAAQAAEQKLTFEQMMAEARERGRNRGRGDEGMEL